MSVHDIVDFFVEGANVDEINREQPADVTAQIDNKEIMIYNECEEKSHNR